MITFYINENPMACDPLDINMHGINIMKTDSGGCEYSFNIQTNEMKNKRSLQKICIHVNGPKLSGNKRYGDIKLINKTIDKTGKTTDEVQEHRSIIDIDKLNKFISQLTNIICKAMIGTLTEQISVDFDALEINNVGSSII